MNQTPEELPLESMRPVEVETEAGPLVLTWLNTVIRTFKDASLNHVEVRTQDGVIGFLTPQSVLDELFEREFPYTFSPILDEPTINWFVGVHAEELDDELSIL